ncbi:hypothetical protein J9332_41700, partial [Aquimarina celericrescens]|nr:hypothetical protein [Aquimarina celericrescens]
SYCPMDKDVSVGTSGTYNMDQTTLVIPCASTASKINFELKDVTLIIDYPTQCMEPCKEKYAKVE